MKKEEPKDKGNLNHQWTITAKIIVDSKDSLLDGESNKAQAVAAEIEKQFAAWGNKFKKSTQGDTLTLEFHMTYTNLTKGKEIPKERAKKNLLDGFIFDLKLLFPRGAIEKGCTFEQFSSAWVYLK